MSKSDKDIIDGTVNALREIVTLSYVTYSMGRFIKTDALLTAAEFVENSLEDRCPKELRDKIRKLRETKDALTDNQDWII